MSGTDPTLPNLNNTPSVVIEDADPLIGLNLSGFVVSKLLASGGMGLVYLAVHETIGRRAAVKVLRPEVAGDAEWIRRFLTEARALASLKHRNLIEVLNFGKTPDGRQYLMMEFLEGEPLDAYIRRVGALAPANALGIADQVLNGLAEAHKKGVVHRDLKPSNIFLLREHNGEMLVKVIDFGLARQEPIALLTEGIVNRLPKSPDGSSLLAGTPEYIAPEQAQGQKVDGSADLYSLGIVLFEMFSGQLPFESQSVPALLQKHLSERPPKLSSLVSNLADGVEEFVESLLEKDPLRRPPSADAARVTCQRLVKRMASEATAVRQMDPKHLPTMKIDRPTMPTAGAGAPVVDQVHDVSPTTNQSLDRAFPKRSVWPAVVIVLLLLLIGVVFVVFRDGSTTPVALVPVPAPTPTPAPVVAEVAPAPKPAADDELVPLPAIPAPPVAAVEKRPALVAAPVVRPKSTVLVEAIKCTPDAMWKKQVKQDLQEIETRAARDPRIQSEFDKVEKQLQRYLSVQTASECVEVERPLEQLKEKIRALPKAE